MMEGVNLIKIYCKHICNITMHPPVKLLHANKQTNKQINKGSGSYQ
jgi:hypothetical protein